MSKRVVAVLAVALGTGMSLVSCSSEPESSETAAASPSPDVCGTADDLRTALAGLGDVQVVQGGTDAVVAAWADVEDAWTPFADAARGEYRDEVDGVQADRQAVQESVQAAQDSPSGQTLGTVATTVRDYLQGAGALVDEATSTC